ncbi:unnamed protein product [Symbiodinium natans]|uniref:Uncharacterized protein n=1 Tax=Symbiodinium natans TaxID=878477 RepID=A0A812JQU2_9DINO|nr:unnamed protein product [Symbiodinium natans]
MGGAWGFCCGLTGSWKMPGADFARTGLRESASAREDSFAAPASWWKRKTFTLLANLFSFYLAIFVRVHFCSRPVLVFGLECCKGRGHVCSWLSQRWTGFSLHVLFSNIPAAPPVQMRRCDCFGNFPIGEASARGMSHECTPYSCNDSSAHVDACRLQQG